MILVDKNIKDLSEQGFLISSGYESKHINSISYDLTLGEFLNTDKDVRGIHESAVFWTYFSTSSSLICDKTISL